MSDTIRINVRRREVLRNGLRIPLTKLQFKIFSTVYYHGMASSDLLMDVLYGHDIGGGPDCGSRALDVHVAHINRRIKLLGARLTGRRQHFREIVDVDR